MQRNIHYARVVVLTCDMVTVVLMFFFDGCLACLFVDPSRAGIVRMSILCFRAIF